MAAEQEFYAGKEGKNIRKKKRKEKSTLPGWITEKNQPNNSRSHAWHMHVKKKKKRRRKKICKDNVCRRFGKKICKKAFSVSMKTVLEAM